MRFCLHERGIGALDDGRDPRAAHGIQPILGEEGLGHGQRGGVVVVEVPVPRGVGVRLVGLYCIVSRAARFEGGVDHEVVVAIHPVAFALPEGLHRDGRTPDPQLVKLAGERHVIARGSRIEFARSDKQVEGDHRAVAVGCIGVHAVSIEIEVDSAVVVPYQGNVVPPVREGRRCPQGVVAIGHDQVSGCIGLKRPSVPCCVKAWVRTSVDAEDGFVWSSWLHPEFECRAPRSDRREVDACQRRDHVACIAGKVEGLGACGIEPVGFHLYVATSGFLSGHPTELIEREPHLQSKLLACQL